MQSQSEFYMLAIDIGFQVFLVCALENMYPHNSANLIYAAFILQYFYAFLFMQQQWAFDLLFND